MAKFTGEARAALVFAIGYLLVFSWMLFCYFTHRFKVKSRYSMLFFHVTVRVASQACGIAFGILGFSNVGLFAAYLLLGAEGYFTLVLCAFRFLISWHQHNLPSHNSWLEPRTDRSKKTQIRKALAFTFLGPFGAIFWYKDPMIVMHSLLILANVAIVVGGSWLSGATFSNVDSRDTQMRIKVAKICRTAGQSVFLGCNFLLMFAIVATIIGDRKRTGKVHPTLIILQVAWFPLIIRGLFGVLQSAVWDLSYFNPDNYSIEGFSHRFTAIEYTLGVATEFLAAVLLNLTWFTSRNDPSTKGESDTGNVETSDAERKAGAA